MVDMVWRDDDDDVGVDTGDAVVVEVAADKSATVGDEAMDVAVDEVTTIAEPGVIGSRSRRTPPTLTWKWTLPNIFSILLLRPEKAERDASA
jgi:hypothetical protein